jgi:hypothetical protein
VRARFAFAPDATARVSYLASALAVAALLALLGVLAIRGRGVPARRRPLAAPESAPHDPLRRLPWRHALALAAAIGLGAGFVFALRAGAGLALATLVLVRLGVSARRLFALAAGLLVAIPLLYLAFPSSDSPGRSFDYAIDHLAAHWVAVVVVCCLAAACALDAHDLRRRLRRG